MHEGQAAYTQSSSATASKSSRVEFLKRMLCQSLVVLIARGLTPIMALIRGPASTPKELAFGYAKERG